MLANPTLWFLLALFSTLLALYHERIRERMPTGSLWLAYSSILGLAYVEHSKAASSSSHFPSVMYIFLLILLILLVTRYARDAMLPHYEWKNEKPTHTLSYSKCRWAGIIIVSFLSAGTQYLFLTKKMIAGIQTPWWLPMLCWAWGIYLLIYPLWKDRPRKEEPFLVRLKSNSFFIPFLSRDSMRDKDKSRWIVLSIVFLGVMLYMTSITSFPTDVHGDEGEVALYGINVRDSGNWNFFQPGWYHIPHLFFLIHAWGMWLFGDNLFGIRMTGALISLASIPFFYLFARRFMKNTPALFATGVYATTAYFLHFSRMGIGYNQTAFFIVCIFYFFIRAVQDRDLVMVCFAGIFSALGMLSYQATQIAPFLIVFSMMLLWIARTFSWRFMLKGIIIYAVSFWVGAAPLVGNAWADPYIAYSRTEFVSVFGDTGQEWIRKGYPADYSNTEIIKAQILRSVLGPITYHDRSPYLINEQYGGMLGPIYAFCFSAAVLLFLRRLFHPPNALLLFWILATLIAGSMITTFPPCYQRLIGLYPFLIVTLTPVLYGILSHINQTFISSKRGKRLFLLFSFIFLLIMSMHRYFDRWMSVPQNLDATTRVARMAKDHGSTIYHYFFGQPSFEWEYGNIRFLAPNANGEDVLDPESFLNERIERRGPVCFILYGNNARYIDSLRELYPAGLEEHHRNIAGRIIFITYEVNLYTLLGHNLNF